MSAAVIPLPERRAERRRATMLRDIAVGLENRALTLREVVPTLGNAQAAVALKVMHLQLESELVRIETLMDEYRELAEQETDEGSE